MFITFEGIEGSGKTTQVKRAARFLRDAGYPCVVTREPGGTRIGEKIRAILLDPEHASMAPMAELMLYLADRMQHVKEVILPALEARKTVLCDRFSDATIVYQGYARDLGIAIIESFHKMILGDISPDLTFLLDLPAATGLSRAWGRIGKNGEGLQESRFEKETLAFHEKIRTGYLDLAQRHSNRVHIINAADSEETVYRHIVLFLSETMEKEDKKGFRRQIIGKNSLSETHGD